MPFSCRSLQPRFFAYNRSSLRIYSSNRGSNYKIFPKFPWCVRSTVEYQSSIFKLLSAFFKLSTEYFIQKLLRKVKCQNMNLSKPELFHLRAVLSLEVNNCSAGFRKGCFSLKKTVSLVGTGINKFHSLEKTGKNITGALVLLSRLLVSEAVTNLLFRFHFIEILHSYKQLTAL